jgi:hypothetical protein
MTYYAIKNHQTYKIDYVETEDLANAKLIENSNYLLERESYRFTLCKEVVDGNNTTWCSVDLNNDDENGTYHVFNHKTGLHELVNGLTNAKNRMQEIKQEFLVDNGLDKWEVVDSIPPEPDFYSSARYGQTVGTIPVEVI